MRSRGRGLDAIAEGQPNMAIVSTDSGALVRPPPLPLDSVVVRFAGDSGDGMQLTGGRFTLSTALAGNDLATFPDFPAEIRAPQGTTFGVSAFQINFGSASIETAGDAPDVLMAMNPAALKVNLADLRAGGLIIADTGAFDQRNLTKAGYAANPLDDGSLAPYQVVGLDISRLTLEAVKPFGLGNREALRCKNMWSLGLVLWMFDRSREPVIQWLKSRFGGESQLLEANIAALNAGHAHGETAELGPALSQCRVPPAPRRSPSASWRAASSPGCRCSSAPTRSLRRVRSCTIWRASRNMTSRHSRPRTKSPQSARRSAPPMPAVSASPRPRAPALPSRPRRSASRSSPNCRSSSSILNAAGRRPECRPRPSNPISTRPSMAATAIRRSSF